MTGRQHPQSRQTPELALHVAVSRFLRSALPMDATYTTFPLGGGGLISGIAIAAKALKPSIRIIGAEPELAGDGAASKREGSIQPAMKPVTIADGLRTSLGPLTFPVVRDLVDEIVLVSEADIATSMRIVWERMKITIEPSAAVGVAVACSAWMRQRNNADMQDVGVVLCGGNVDLAALPWL